MGILFHCSSCDRPLNVGEQFAGKPGVCPNCKKTISVPEKSAIADINFRYLLEAWTARQQTGQTEQTDLSVTKDVSNSSDVLTEGVPAVVTGKQATRVLPKELPSELPVVGRDAASLNSNPVAPKVVLKPINVGGVVTDSENVSEGIAQKFSASEPDALENGVAVWFIRPASGGQFGPASSKLLRQWIEQGRVTGDSFVWCEGWDNWQVASDVFPSIAHKVSVEAVQAANADVVTAAKTRTAYRKAEKRRTMRNTIGMVIGTVVLIGLIIALVMVIKNPVS